MGCVMPRYMFLLPVLQWTLPGLELDDVCVAYVEGKVITVENFGACAGLSLDLVVLLRGTHDRGWLALELIVVLAALVIVICGACIVDLAW